MSARVKTGTFWLCVQFVHTYHIIGFYYIDGWVTWDFHLQLKTPLPKNNVLCNTCTLYLFPLPKTFIVPLFTNPITKIQCDVFILAFILVIFTMQVPHGMSQEEEVVLSLG